MVKKVSFNRLDTPRVHDLQMRTPPEGAFRNLALLEEELYNMTTNEPRPTD